MKIVDVGNQDTGGQSFKLTQAINRYCSPHISRSFLMRDDYLKFPKDVLHQPEWGSRENPKHPEWIKEYWLDADIVHVHNYKHYVNNWPPTKSDVKILLHHHSGTIKKSAYGTPEEVVKNDTSSKTYRVVSTINLLPYVDNNINRWLPAPMDIEWFDKFKKENYVPHDTIKIIQTATGVSCKKPHLFVSAVNKVKEKHKNVEVVLVQNTSWLECQKIKASCDILFDDFLAFGNTSYEAWLLGIPVVTSPEEGAHEQMLNALDGNVPYMPATVDNLANVLEQLVVDESLRKEYARKGREYMEKWHSYQFVANRAIRMYKEIE